MSKDKEGLSNKGGALLAGAAIGSANGAGPLSAGATAECPIFVVAENSAIPSLTA